MNGKMFLLSKSLPSWGLREGVDMSISNYETSEPSRYLRQPRDPKEGKLRNKLCLRLKEMLMELQGARLGS